MLPHRVAEAVGQQEWLDSIADTAQQAIHGAVEAAGPAGREVKDALHGVWLGHALHPALVTVPLGAWTVTLVLDALEAMRDRRDLAAGADAALAIGLVGAAGSALSGAADWSDTDGEARRMGITHGLMNLGVTALYALSLARRRQGDRAAGRALATLGYAASLASAYLGGHLSYAKRIGVSHADIEAAPREFTPVRSAADLPEGQPQRVEVEGVPVVLVRQGDRIFALAETCSHLGGPLAEGTVEDGSIRCPWHGSRFALDDGRVLDGPATTPQPCFAVRIREGRVEIRPAHGRELSEGDDQSTSHRQINEPMPIYPDALSGSEPGPLADA
jgi:nitrite reductase/ring-hydroxylating ferredoxin subunit